MAGPVVGVGTLRRLAELPTDGPTLSVYLGCDYVRASSESERERILLGLLAELWPVLVMSERRSICEMSRSLPPLAYGTRGLALFSCAAAASGAVVPLPCATVPIAVTDGSFWFEPIAAMCHLGDATERPPSTVGHTQLASLRCKTSAVRSGSHDRQATAIADGG